MASSDKITILLADEDALRRDGLTAVLHGTPHFEVIAQCPDGETAINQIRQLRPDVAVVDLNLPKLHGIELVRRVRGEVLGTKVVILSGTADDDIIREVVRAGGDAYLLKNGPARHLVDAIFLCARRRPIFFPRNFAGTGSTGTFSKNNPARQPNIREAANKALPAGKRRRPRRTPKRRRHPPRGNAASVQTRGRFPTPQ